MAVFGTQNSPMYSDAAGCGKELGLGAGNRCSRFLKIHISGSVGLFPMLTVEYRVIPSQLKFSSPKESHSQNFIAGGTSLPEKEEAARLIKASVERACLNVLKKTRKAERTSRGSLPGANH